MYNKLLIAVCSVMFMTLSSAWASSGVTMSYSTGNKTYFSFQIPDDWKVNVGFEVDPKKMPEGETPKPRMITAMPNDKSRLWFGMWVPKSIKNLTQAKKYLGQFRGFFVENPVTTKVKKSKVNGMEVTTFIGNGEREGKIVDIAVVVFQLTKDNMGIAIYIGPPESTKLHIKKIDFLVKSIQPAH
ncbi:MAG: hypothetical protein ACC653_13055 [Gammaproteobacteria bacterium]